MFNPYRQYDVTPSYTEHTGGSPFTKEKETKKSLTYEILNLFVKKLINPGLYHNYELTLRQFNNSLDFFERKISNSIYKVTREIKIKDADVPEDVMAQVKRQYEYCVEGGELFLEAIDEMKFYIDHVSEDIGNPDHMDDCDWEQEEHLEEGLDIAYDADEYIMKSLKIYDDLYDLGY